MPLAGTWSREPELLDAVRAEVMHPAEPLQRAAAHALAHLVARDERDPAAALAALQDTYRGKLPMIPARLDQFGHVVEKAVDEWSARRGVGFALRALAPHLRAERVADAMRFFVEHGLADRHDDVRAEMLNAAMAIVDLHGKVRHSNTFLSFVYIRSESITVITGFRRCAQDTIGSQLPVFEKFMDTAPKSSKFDAVRQCVVLLVGSLARHLEPTDERIKPITMRLIGALNTPSQQVRACTHRPPFDLN